MFKCRHCSIEVFPCTMCAVDCNMYFHAESACIVAEFDGYIAAQDVLRQDEDLPLEEPDG